MLSALQIQTIEAQFDVQQARVFIIDVDGQKMVIKRQEVARPAWRYRILRACARMFNEPLLMPAHVPGGAEAQAIEVSRLQRLAVAGVAVPKIFYIASHWFAIEYLGTSNLRDKMLHGENPPSHYWEQAVSAILETHRKGQNLSQAFFRNLMYDKGQVFFIDFEDDPERSMGLAKAQARDWLFFLFSSTWLVGLTPNQLVDLFWRYLQNDHLEVREAVFHLVKTTGWLRFLPKKRHPWGRDVMAAQAYAQLIFNLNKKYAKING